MKTNSNLKYVKRYDELTAIAQVAISYNQGTVTVAYYFMQLNKSC
jgi:hypothetical protein